MKNNWSGIHGGPPSNFSSAFPIGQVSFFSSPGPTRGGLNKPDLFAPGAYVASAKSANDAVPPSEQFYYSNYSDYIYKGGTSIAAPHVTGAVALLLEKWTVERRVDMTYEDVMSYLNASESGSGVVDVFSLIALDEVVGIEDRVEMGGYYCSNNPTQINPDQNYTYCATFYDEDCFYYLKRAPNFN